MVAIYAIATVLGLIGIIAWVALGMVASAVPGKEALEPESRFGAVGRTTIAAVAGFGLGGMSASYAGATTPVAIGGAVLGGVLTAFIGRYLGFEDDAEGDSV